MGTPVMVVKLDNTPNAQPHRGLTKADIVYVEPVEWGLTRLAAVFSTQLPGTVGPVRSARITDIDLFAPFGNVAFVYSGAQRRAAAEARGRRTGPRSPRTSTARVSSASGARAATPRTTSWPTRRRSWPPRAPTAVSQDIGFVFDEQPPDGGKEATRVTARWPSMSVQFRWNAKKDLYDVWMNGRQARDTDKAGVQRASVGHRAVRQAGRLRIRRQVRRPHPPDDRDGVGQGRPAARRGGPEDHLGEGLPARTPRPTTTSTGTPWSSIRDRSGSCSRTGPAR